MYVSHQIRCECDISRSSEVLLFYLYDPLQRRCNISKCFSFTRKISLCARETLLNDTENLYLFSMQAFWESAS